MNSTRLTLLCIGLILPLMAAAASVTKTQPAPAHPMPTRRCAPWPAAGWPTTTASACRSASTTTGSVASYNFGTTQLDGNHPPTKDTVYEIGSISKTFTAQLLARAMVEGRASLNDEVDRYLRRPIPEPGRGRREDTPAAPRQHDLAAGGQHPGPHPGSRGGRRAARGHAHGASSALHRRRNCCASCTTSRRAARRATIRRTPTWPACCSASRLEKIYGEPFDEILTREIEKPLRMASGTDPDTKLLAKGYTREGEPLPPFEAPDGLAVDRAALQHGRPVALRLVAAGGTGRVGEGGAPAHLVHSGPG